MSLPTWGAWYSTRQVGNRMAEPCVRPTADAAGSGEAVRLRPDRGQRGVDLAAEIGAAQRLVAEAAADAPAPGFVQYLLGSEHEPGEVELPFVLTRDVGAVDVAELAVEALVDDLALLGPGELGGVLVVVPVD